MEFIVPMKAKYYAMIFGASGVSCFHFRERAAA